MSQEILKQIDKKLITKNIPEIKRGYTVTVDTIITEGSKSRIQKFTGLIIAINGRGANKMITVRKISNGVGVEKKLPIYSPKVGLIKVIKIEDSRRAKLYFMRDRVGKNAMRIKKGKASLVENTSEYSSSDIVEEVIPEEVIDTNVTSEVSEASE